MNLGLQIVTQNIKMFTKCPGSDHVLHLSNGEFNCFRHKRCLLVNRTFILYEIIITRDTLKLAFVLKIIGSLFGQQNIKYQVIW